MRQVKRATLSILIACISLPALYWVLSEAAVSYEMMETGAKTRAELEDDFGLGLLGLFVVLPGTVIGAIAVGLVTWFLSRQARKTKVENA